MGDVSWAGVAMVPERQRRRVLLVEDEELIALYVEDVLGALNCDVVETAASLSQAADLARSGDYDLAILDLKLHGALSYPVADILRARGIPVVFVTAYGAGGVDAAYADVPVLEKPFQEHDLAALVRRMVPA
jgi:CheY-like chemotaxis protein